MFEIPDPHDPFYLLEVNPSQAGRAYAREHGADLIPALKAKLEEDERMLNCQRLQFWLTAAQLLDQFDPDHDNADRVQAVWDAYHQGRIGWLEAWNRAMDSLDLDQATRLLSRYGGYHSFAGELLHEDYPQFVNSLAQAVNNWRATKSAFPPTASGSGCSSSLIPDQAIPNRSKLDGLELVPGGIEYHGHFTPLKGRGWEVLRDLLAARNQTLTFVDLQGTIWSETAVTPDAIRIAVSTARKALREAMQKGKVEGPKNPIVAVDRGHNLAWRLERLP